MSKMRPCELCRAVLAAWLLPLLSMMSFCLSALPNQHPDRQRLQRPGGHAIAGAAAAGSMQLQQDSLVLVVLGHDLGQLAGVQLVAQLCQQALHLVPT